MSRIIERLVKYEEWENKYGESLRKQLNEGEEVVRCGECKKRYTKDCFRAHYNYEFEDWEVERTNPDDFCSYGEREGE